MCILKKTPSRKWFIMKFSHECHYDNARERAWGAPMNINHHKFLSLLYLIFKFHFSLSTTVIQFALWCHSYSFAIICQRWIHYLYLHKMGFTHLQGITSKCWANSYVCSPLCERDELTLDTLERERWKLTFHLRHNWVFSCYQTWFININYPNL